MEGELMEAGGAIDEASWSCWSCICLWGNEPQERPVFLPHAAPRSESNTDALDDRRATMQVQADTLEGLHAG